MGGRGGSSAAAVRMVLRERRRGQLVRRRLAGGERRRGVVDRMEAVARMVAGLGEERRKLVAVRRGVVGRKEAVVRMVAAVLEGELRIGLEAGRHRRRVVGMPFLVRVC